MTSSALTWRGECGSGRRPSGSGRARCARRSASRRCPAPRWSSLAARCLPPTRATRAPAASRPTWSASTRAGSRSRLWWTALPRRRRAGGARAPRSPPTKGCSSAGSPATTRRRSGSATRGTSRLREGGAGRLGGLTVPARRVCIQGVAEGIAAGVAATLSLRRTGGLVMDAILCVAGWCGGTVCASNVACVSGARIRHVMVPAAYVLGP
mmetsp:Transcript_39672/g.127961  ORF Transcript_39672/g.127961 Transcript_39672/m.127961 type:complete len:210 (+) Transcript_39672:429-1058(+)